MGSVCKTRDIHKNKSTALNIIKEALTDPEDIECFKAEFKFLTGV